MSNNLLQPNWEAGISISDLPTNRFIDLGIKALVLDVDGTLIPNHQESLHKSVISWVKDARKHFDLHLLSNNPSKKRIGSISEQLNIQFTYKAAKPTRRALRSVLQKLQFKPQETAIIGDRLFTDILAGNRLGLYTVLVLPIGPNGETARSKKTQLIEQRIAQLLGAKKS